MNITSEFRMYARPIIFDLHARFGLSDIHAAAIVGNAGRESGGFKYFVQLDDNKPLRGIGLFQWSGARHTSFANYCAQAGLEKTTIEASVRFLMFELGGAYRSALRYLIATPDLYSATASFERHYEMAGITAIEERYMWADAALALPAVSKGIVTRGTSA